MNEKKKLVDNKRLATWAVANAKALKQGAKELHDVPLDVVANLLAYGAGKVIDENPFNLYIAEKKIKGITKPKLSR